MASIEHLSGKDDIPENVYLEACDALKDLHPVTKLFRVTYLEFYIEEDVPYQGGRAPPFVGCKTETTIMEQRGETETRDEGFRIDWADCFQTRKLPYDMSHLRVDGRPFLMNNYSQIIVTSSIASYAFGLLLGAFETMWKVLTSRMGLRDRRTAAPASWLQAF